MQADEGRSLSMRRRTAISSQAVTEIDAQEFSPPQFFPKSQDDLRNLNAILYHNCLFSHLENTELASVVESMRKEIYPRGAVIMNQGGKGEQFYVIGRGQVEVVINGARVSRIREGGCFGELELMYDTPCAATIKADSDHVEVWGIDRQTYRLLIMNASLAKRRQYEGLLAKVPIFLELSSYEKLTLADALTPQSYEDGEYILKYGEEGEWMYIIVEGVVTVVGRSADNEPIKVCEFREGGYFGDLEFINNHTHVADVIAKGPVKTVKLNRYHIELCMGTVKSQLQSNLNNPVFDYYREKMLARTFKFIGGGGRRRAPVSSESEEPLDTTFTPPSVPKADAEQAMLIAQLERNSLFAVLGEADLRIAVDAMTHRSFKASDIITRQGERQPAFYVLCSGTCTSQIDEHEPTELPSGATFGEMELLFNTPCAATITAQSAVEAYTIDRQTYRHVRMRLQIRKRKQAQQLLSRIALFDGFSDYEYLILAENLEEQTTLRPGDSVVSIGSDVSHLVIVLEGVVEISGKEDPSDPRSTLIQLGSASPQSCPFLGDAEILTRCETFLVSGTATSVARIAKLPASRALSCLSPLITVLSQRFVSPTEPLAAYYRRWVPPANLGYLGQ